MTYAVENCDAVRDINTLAVDKKGVLLTQGCGQ